MGSRRRTPHSDPFSTTGGQLAIKMAPAFFRPGSGLPAHLPSTSAASPNALQRQIFEYSPPLLNPLKLDHFVFAACPCQNAKRVWVLASLSRPGAPPSPRPCPPSALSADTESAPGPPPFSSATLPPAWGLARRSPHRRRAEAAKRVRRRGDVIGAG